MEKKNTMNLKNEITEIMKEYINLTKKTNNMDEEIEKLLYSDDKYSPEVQFGSGFSCSDTECNIEIEIKYNDASTMSDEIIKKIIDSINETFSVFNDYKPVDVYDFECDYSTKCGKVNFALDYEE